MLSYSMHGEHPRESIKKVLDAYTVEGDSQLIEVFFDLHQCHSRLSLLRTCPIAQHALQTLLEVFSVNLLFHTIVECICIRFLIKTPTAVSSQNT